MSASGDGSGLFGSIPDSLPDRMRPSLENGVLKPLANVFIAIVGGIVSALGIGLAAIPIGAGRAINNGVRSLASFLSDLVWAFFGPIAEANWTGGAEAFLSQFGIFGYVAAVVIVVAGMYAFAEVLPGDG